MHSLPCFSSQKRCQRNDTLFINNYINFIHAWGNFDRSIKVTPGVIKVTPSETPGAIKVTLSVIKVT